MKTNPILEEVWRIKDELSAEAGHDVKRFFEQLREWSAAHPHDGPVVHSAEELGQLIKRRKDAAAALAEEPPKYGGK